MQQNTGSMMDKIWHDSNVNPLMEKASNKQMCQCIFIIFWSEPKVIKPFTAVIY